MKKKVNTFWWFLGLILYLEIIYKGFAFNNLFSFGTIYLLPFTLIYVGINSLITGLFKQEKVNKIITFVFTAFLTIYYCAQFVYYKFYQAMISLYSLKMGTTQVFGWIDQILLVILRNIFVVLLIFLPLILLIIFHKKYFTFERNLKYRNYLYSFVLLSGIVLSSLCLLPNKRDAYSNFNLLFKVHYPTLMVNRVGLSTTAVVDAFRFITSFEESYVGKSYDTTNVTFDSKKYNMLDIDFNELLKEETDDELKEMHKYFMNKVPSNKNDYTGMFKGKNLIFINAESFDSIAIDKELTPTLYKMKNEGIVFDNYYVPLFPVSTADGEYMNSTSLLPKEGVWSLYETSKISVPFSLGNVFGNLGYNTFAYHNHSYDFYNRQLIYPNMGFESYLACGNGLEEVIDCTLWPESDEELFTKTVNNFASKENFLAYFMTVSGHLRYTPNNDISKKNWSYVNDLDTSDSYKSYLAQNIDLENGITALINTLEEKDILDDTVIVIAPDHYPYGFTNSEIKEIDSSRDGKFDLFRTSLIIWNSDMESVKVSKTTSSLDIIPTLYNLFGVDYDSRLFMGNDVFSDNEGIAILADRSFITDKLKYDAIKDKVTYFDENDMDYLNEKRKEVYEKFTFSSKILEYNYYEKLASYLD